MPTSETQARPQGDARNLDDRGREYALPHGKLKVSYASAQDGIALFTAATALLQQHRVGKDVPDAELFVILNADDRVRSLVMESCARAAAYEGRSVNAALFDDAKLGNRACADYAAIFTSIFSWNFGRFSSGSSA